MPLNYLTTSGSDITSGVGLTAAASAPGATYNVKSYGAKGDGVTDDTAAIANAIAAAQSAGRGNVYLPAGQYVISSPLSVTASFIGIIGDGLNISTVLVGSVGKNGIAFTGTATTPLKNVVFSGVSVVQNNVTAAGIGVQFKGTSVASFQESQVSGFKTGVLLQRATNTRIQRVFSTFNPSAPTSGAIGFDINGDPIIVTTGITLTQAVTGGSSAQTVNVSSTTNITPPCLAQVDTEWIYISSATSTSVTGIFRQNHANGAALSAGATGDYGGNASSVFRDAAVDMSASTGGYPNVSSSSIGFYVHGAYCGDLLFDCSDTSYPYTGYYVDLSTATSSLSNGGGGNNEDIVIRYPTIDFYTNQGVYINGTGAAPADNLSMVTIDVGWLDPYPSAGSPYGIQAHNTRGVDIRGVQVYPGNPTSAMSVGVRIDNSSNVAVSGCLFRGQLNGVSTSGATDSNIVGNTFYNSSSAAATVQANITSSSRVALIGNNFDGYATSAPYYFDAATTACAAIGNTINTVNLSSVAVPPSNAGTNNRMSNNPGQNPVGHISSPAFPASNATYTNNTGYDLLLCIFAGTSPISGISIGGYSTSLSIAASGQLALPLPVGQTISFTYAAGSPVWTFFAS